MNCDEISVFTWHIFTFVTVEHCSRNVDEDLWWIWNFHHRCDQFNDEIQNVIWKNFMYATISTSDPCHPLPSLAALLSTTWALRGASRVLPWPYVLRGRPSRACRRAGRRPSRAATIPAWALGKGARTAAPSDQVSSSPSPISSSRSPIPLLWLDLGFSCLGHGWGDWRGVGLRWRSSAWVASRIHGARETMALYTRGSQGVHLPAMLFSWVGLLYC